MTIERATHLAFSLGLFERMDDQMLLECFKPAGLTAPEIREHLAELRSQGYEYVPCNCGHYDATGACTGEINKPEREAETLEDK
jgi:hypothetical protein